MKHYIIDGNNLIGKIKSLASIQKKDKQASREKLTHLIDRFFANKKVTVTLNFDGFANEKIKSVNAKIVYSENLSADDKIKKQIEEAVSKRNIVVVTSDNNIKEFAKVCGCEVISSDAFGREITLKRTSNDEEARIKEINDVDTFKKMFGVK